MEFGLIPASEGTFPVDGSVVTEMVRAAERVGFDSIWVGEHVIMSAREEYPGAAQNRIGPSPTGEPPGPDRVAHVRRRGVEPAAPRHLDPAAATPQPADHGEALVDARSA